MYASGNWGERSEPHTCGENGKLSICIYICLVRAYSVYVYILPHLCAMQYFHIVHVTTVAQD